MKQKKVRRYKITYTVYKRKRKVFFKERKLWKENLSIS